MRLRHLEGELGERQLGRGGDKVEECLVKLITNIFIEKEAKRQGQIKGFVERSFLRFEAKVELDEGLERNQLENVTNKGRTRSVLPQERKGCVASLDVVRAGDLTSKSTECRLVSKKEGLEEVPEGGLEGELLIRTS